MTTHTLTLDDDQAGALSVLIWWVLCLDAGRALDDEPPVADDCPVLHHVANGATAIVTMGHLRTIANFPAVNETATDRGGTG